MIYTHYGVRKATFCLQVIPVCDCFDIRVIFCSIKQNERRKTAEELEWNNYGNLNLSDVFSSFSFSELIGLTFCVYSQRSISIHTKLLLPELYNDLFSNFLSFCKFNEALSALSGWIMCGSSPSTPPCTPSRLTRAGLTRYIEGTPKKSTVYSGPVRPWMYMYGMKCKDN